MYVGILFGLSALVCLVRPCSRVYWNFIRSYYVSMLSTAMVSCILVFYSVLVRQCSMYIGIFFGLSTLVRLVRPCSMYVRILSGLSTLVRLVRQCSHVCCYFFWS